MKKVMNYIALMAGLFILHPSLAQKQAPPEGGAPMDFKLPQKQEKKLGNGLKTTFVKYGDIPKVNISLIIKTGNVHEGPDQVWLADLTGKLLNQGTKDMNFTALSQKVAAMGGQVYISVGQDQTTVSGAVLSDYAADFIKVIADLVINPAFPEGELNRLKSDLKRQLAVQKAVPQTQATEKFMEVVYRNSPYARYFPTEEMLDSYTLPMVKDFYSKNFGAKRSVLYVVGQFDEAAVSAAANSAFGKWKAGPDPSYPSKATSFAPERIVVDRKSAPQTTIILGLPVAAPSNPDYVAEIVANSLLGGSFGSRITSNIRENKGYTYSPNAAVQNRKGGSVWMENADVTSEHTIDAIREIEKEIKRLQTEAPSKDELKGIQNYEAGIFVLRNSSPGGIIGQLNFLDLYGLPDTYLTNMVKSIHAVTPSQVSEIVKKYLPFDKMTLVMVGDKEAIEKQSGNQQ